MVIIFFHIFHNSVAGGSQVIEYGHMPQIECAPCWSTADGFTWTKGMWCIIWSIHRLPSIDIFGCIFLQVILLSNSFFLLIYLSCQIKLYLIASSTMCLNFISMIDLHSQLKDDFLSATASSCPLTESLVLMSCPSVGPDGLSSLHRLPNLTYLDLSYTFLVNLQPVFDSCLYLKVLCCISLLHPLSSLDE